MKKNLEWFLFGAFVSFIALLFLNKCENKPVPVSGNNTNAKKIEEKKKQNDTIRIEVIKWKQAKTKIIYRTKFDSTATIDTIIVELNKCDSVNKTGDSIILKQDKIIANLDTITRSQEEMILDLDSHNALLQDDNKKIKRKLLFTKILAGVIIIFTIIATN